MPLQNLIWEYTQPDADQVNEAKAEFDVPDVYARILVSRGITTRSVGKSFFNPGRHQLHDPSLMKNMDLAAERVAADVEAENPILVFGDYDVDGTTAASMLSLSLEAMGGRVSTYIPSRENEGYGVSKLGIDYAEMIGAKLMITCDCGINATEQVDYALSKGIDVIITDHHTPDTTLPNALAILNPKQSDCPYPFKGLCGAGVAFKLALAVADRLNADPDTVWRNSDLVALGTAADIVPIIDENRAIVTEGLKLINERSRPGIAALWQAAGMAGKDLTIGRLVFGVAPKINAAGRLGDAGRAVKLLTTDNHYRAMKIAKELVKENTRRQEIQENTVAEAIYQVNSNHDLSKEKVLVLHSDGWHQGVIGIVAARIRDTFHRPTAIIAVDNGIGKGSLRSMAGFDLYEALTQCREHLIGYGGHTVAAGLSIESDKLDIFEQTLLSWADQNLTMEQLRPRQVIDGDCTLDIIDSRFMRFLGSLEPYGPGNRRPVFASRGVSVTGTPRLLGDAAHLKFKVKQNGVTFDTIGFNMADHFEKLILDRPIDIAYIVEENVWRGKRSVQLQLKDIKMEGNL